MTAAISVTNLTKQYGLSKVVDTISFDVPEGSIFAFLGTNGAGKSTTINCIVTTLIPSSGTIYIKGKEVGKENDSIKNDIGVVFQSSILDPLLTVRENLKMRGKLYDKKISQTDRIAELVDLIDMKEFIDRRYGKLSGGQKRRADIARAIFHNPSILFLDEPTTGLDPKSRESVWTLIHSLQKEQGKTIFLTTHYMEETENADMVAILRKGRIVSSGTPQYLRAHYSKNILRLVPKDSESLTRHLKQSLLDFAIVQGEIVQLQPESSEAALHILETVRAHITDFEFRHGTMDDVFLELAEKESEG